MNLTDDFIPNGGSATTKKIWKQYGLVLLLLSVPMLFVPATVLEHCMIEACIMGIILIMLVFDHEAIMVTITGLDNKLTYRTVNCFGTEKTKTVELNNAQISYKYARLSRYKSGMRLRLYNNYFSNRVTLKDLYNGFTEEQMDKMVELINKYRGTESQIIKSN